MSDVISMRGGRERGGILAWMAISFLLVCAAVVIAGVFIVHTIRVHETNGKEVQVESPFGSLHVQRDGHAGVQPPGIPVYPGAKPLRDGETATVDLSSASGDKDLHIVAGKWETTDPIEKVQKYYEDKFPDMSVIQHTGKVEMHSIDRHAKRVIVLRQRGSSTEIALASVGEPKAN